MTQQRQLQKASLPVARQSCLVTMRPHLELVATVSQALLVGRAVKAEGQGCGGTAQVVVLLFVQCSLQQGAPKLLVGSTRRLREQQGTQPGALVRQGLHRRLAQVLREALRWAQAATLFAPYLRGPHRP